MKVSLTVGTYKIEIPGWLFWPWLVINVYIGIRYIVCDLVWFSGLM